eukprot:m.1103382 g.1103382  ORF g.1103382 m.1103382 type:complete len:305 (-) comp24331_c2_seq12:2068-2982(-)
MNPAGALRRCVLGEVGRSIARRGCVSRTIASIVAARSLPQHRYPKQSSSHGTRPNFHCSTSSHLRHAQYFSTETPSLTFEDHMEISENHLELLMNDKKAFGKSLNAIRTNTDPKINIMEKWQAAMQVFMASHVHCFVPYGFSGDVQGLQAYQLAFEDVSKNHDNGSELESLNKRKWEVLVEKAFGFHIKDDDIMSLEQARHITGMLGMRMQSEEFLSAVEKNIGALDLSTDKQQADIQKQQVLVSLLAPLQKEVGENFSYTGDEGYIRMQTGLVKWQSDDQIAYNTATATMAVFRRAGITIPQQ